MKNDIEKQLNNLPQVKLGLTADLKLRRRLYILMWQKKIKQSLPLYRIERLGFALTAGCLFLCLAAIVPGYAYASPAVTRGHFLYPVKKIIEAAELKINDAPIAKINTLEKLAGRRLAETLVINQKKAGPDKKEADVRGSLSEALALTAEASRRAEMILDQAEQAKAEVIINESGKKHQSRLNDLAGGIGFNADEETLDAIALAFEEIKKAAKKTDMKKYLKNSDSPDNKDAIISAPASSATAADAVIREKLAEMTDKNNNQTDRSEVNAVIFGTSTEVKKNNLKKETKQIKNKVESLKENLKIENYNPGEVKALADNLDNKIKKAEKAQDEGRLDEVGDILKKIEALSNNAEHFFKKSVKNAQPENSDNKTNISPDENAAKNNTENNTDKNKKDRIIPAVPVKAR